MGSVAGFRARCGTGRICPTQAEGGAAVGCRKQFKGRQFADEVILWAVRWYLMFPISYRDLELMLLDRGGGTPHFPLDPGHAAREADPAASADEQRLVAGGRDVCWVKGRWTYLYRAVDSCGQTIDFLLSAKRDAGAAKRFFRKALAQPHTVNPRTVTVDKNPTIRRPSLS